MKKKYLLLLFFVLTLSNIFLLILNDTEKGLTAPATPSTVVPNSPATESTSTQGLLLEDERNTINIYEHNKLSVVNITTSKTALSWYYGMREVPQGSGTGFIWNRNGYIVTNFHVIQGGNTFFVTFHKDPKNYPAKLVGATPSKDIAVLKLVEQPQELKPIEAGVSKNLKVGQKVIAIGNPFGLDQTATTGIVSALDRQIQGVAGIKIYGMIQTDASINPGNSGGPLLDSTGHLIGMNTMIYSQSGSSAGVGFAVPADIITRYVPQLITHGKIIRPGLGVELLSDQYKDQIGLDKGLVIAEIQEGGPAEKAGLIGLKADGTGRYHLGDIILKINDQEVNNYDDIYNTLDQYQVGDTIEVTYLRNKKILTVKVKLILAN